MPATTASHIIWFIAAIMIAGAIVGSFIAIIYKISDGMETMGDEISETLKIGVKIINDPEMVRYNNTTSVLYVYVQNTGQSILNRTAVMVQINGISEVVEPQNITIITFGTTEWTPGAVAQLNVTVTSTTLQENTDYYMRVDVFDIYARASAYDSIAFRIKYI